MKLSSAAGNAFKISISGKQPQGVNSPGIGPANTGSPIKKVHGPDRVTLSQQARDLAMGLAASATGGETESPSVYDSAMNTDAQTPPARSGRVAVLSPPEGFLPAPEPLVDASGDPAPSNPVKSASRLSFRA